MCTCAFFTCCQGMLTHNGSAVNLYGKFIVSVKGIWHISSSGKYLNIGSYLLFSLYLHLIALYFPFSADTHTFPFNCYSFCCVCKYLASYTGLNDPERRIFKLLVENNCPEQECCVYLSLVEQIFVSHPNDLIILLRGVKQPPNLLSKCRRSI